MSKEILIYGGIYDFTVESFMREMEEAKNEDIVLRINTNGGDPQSSFGVVSKFQEHAKGKTLRVDGKAYSTGALMAAYADYVIALDVSEFLIHRVAYPSYFENDSNLFTEQLQASLKYSNEKAREALESKVDVEKFQRFTGYSFDQIFSMDGRLDVYLTAEQAKKVGLVDEIRKITPEMRHDIAQNMEMTQLKAAKYLGIQKENQEKPNEENDNTHKDMNLDKLKAEFPAVYRQAMQEGVAFERDRVEAYMVFADVDLNTVKEAIAKGETMTAKQSAEFGRKLASAVFIKNAENDSIGDLDTRADSSDPDKTAEQTAKEAKEAEVAEFYAKFEENLALNRK